MLISESDDGRATAWIRQNAGNLLKAVKNSGEARRTIIGGTNLPESTSCAEMTVVFSNRWPRRAEQDCARNGSGARQQSASAHAERWIVIEALAMRYFLTSGCSLKNDHIKLVASMLRVVRPTNHFGRGVPPGQV
jgi:hypothetical protein